MYDRRTSRPLLALSHLPSGLLVLAALPCLVAAQGSLVSWGRDDVSQVSNTPAGSDFTEVACGTLHSVALRTDGSIVTWGSDFYGQVSTNPTDTGFTQVTAGDAFSLALRADGSIHWWGDGFGGVGSALPTGTGFTQVDAGLWHALALRADGSIAAWGSDGAGQVSDAPSGTGFVQVSAGHFHSAALRSDGSIVSWGSDHVGQVSSTPTGVGYTEVGAGATHSSALAADGSIVTWGLLSDVVTTPTGTGFAQLAVGYVHSQARHGDGSIVVWGDNRYGQISDRPDGVGFTRIATGSGHSLAIRTDNLGSAYCFGDGSGTECPCGGNGTQGQGCANSGGFGGASLRGLGNAYLSADEFELQVVGVPGTKPGLILRGAAQLNGGLGNPVGDGLLCTGSQTARSQVQVTSLGGTTFSDFRGAPFGMSSYGPGVQVNYQFWYRDSANTCSGSGFNLSNAWEVVWLP